MYAVLASCGFLIVTVSKSSHGEKSRGSVVIAGPAEIRRPVDPNGDSYNRDNKAWKETHVSRIKCETLCQIDSRRQFVNPLDYDLPRLDFEFRIGARTIYVFREVST